MAKNPVTPQAMVLQVKDEHVCSHYGDTVSIVCIVVKSKCIVCQIELDEKELALMHLGLKLEHVRAR